MRNLTVTSLASLMLVSQTTFAQEVLRTEPTRGTFAWKHEEGKSLSLLLDEQVLWTLHFDASQPHAYFHPLALPATPALTVDAPKDHVWHHGLWFSWKFLNGVNYWENAPKADRPAGRTAWDPPKVEAREDHSARIAMTLRYGPAEGEPLLVEERTLVVDAPDLDGSYVIHWKGTFRAQGETVVLDRTPLPGEPGGKVFGGYAGLSLRMTNFEERAAATPDGPVAYNEQSRYRGRHAAFEYGGLLNDLPVGIAIVANAKNLNAPSPWYSIRSGAMSFVTPAVICYGPHTLEPGARFTLRYEVHVHPGRWNARRLATLVNDR